MAINKVQTQSGEVLIDLTGDTVTASDIVAGKTAHDRSGTQVTGTFAGQEKTATANGEVTRPYGEAHYIDNNGEYQSASWNGNSGDSGSGSITSGYVSITGYD